MTTEEIVKAAHEAGFGSSEIHKRLAEFKRLIESAAAAERNACADILDRNSDRCDPYSIAFDVLDSNAKAIRARGQA